MSIVAEYLGAMLQSGVQSLASYLAAHVLLCLVPAFFIAGAMSTLIPKDAVTRYLGRDAPKWASYPAAAVGGFVLAVCSCTILPLFAAIYKKGAGLGPAITFLFVGPAINILALTYTAAAIGLDLALARLVLSIVFGIGIGLIMALIYRRDDRKRDQESGAPSAFSARAKVNRATWLFLGLLFGVLIVGTLQVGLLKRSYAHLVLPVSRASEVQARLNRIVPSDNAIGKEGVSIQGLFLVLLMVPIGISGWYGLNGIDEGFNRWSWISIALIVLTLAAAAMRWAPNTQGLEFDITGRLLGEMLIIAMLGVVAWRCLSPYEVQEWLWEVWRFTKMIFPLLIVGVFAAGMVRVIVPPSVIQSIAGENTILANLAGVAFGVFMYFPTLVEVPIANMFLSLGMHRGPLLAYLMADPELSIQSILITAKIIGKGKAWVYVIWVALFSTLAGLIYGWFEG